MKKIWCLVVALAVFIASDALAARVFLKDGSVVQCQSFWRSKDTVYVEVNRDVLLEFAPGEVNVKKTFRARPVKKAKTVALSEEQPAETAGSAADAPSESAAATQSSAKPAPSTSASPKTTNPPAGSPGAAAATPGVKQVPGAGTPSTPTPVKPAPVTAAAAKPAPPQPVPSPVIPAPAAMTEAAGLGFGLTFMLVPLLLVIIMIAAMWRVFEKAGEAGWKALIPIYNLYVLVLIAGKAWWWFLIIIFVPLIGFIFYLLVCLSLAQKFNKSPLYGVLLCFFGFIMFPLLAFDNSTYTA
ncbi:DUF5684 domain-containing protein [Geobacter sp. AOG1]|uniref:DUF5684 domain-containing protein n=1 Tax=Geobacter sp. AOG1 TaxID=1566346 RepID=UPI001CC6B35D|nr:DUF5684 domain-containing protein [Geobacter sp. AOG1]GFE58428.1 hypothetical protein AOG1_23080 [Geobacter sp. AOG1]